MRRACDGALTWCWKGLHRTEVDGVLSGDHSFGALVKGRDSVFVHHHDGQEHDLDCGRVF